MQHVINPFLLGADYALPAHLAKTFRHAHAKGGGKGGGGGGSSKEYERQLAEQRQAREAAEAESSRLKDNQDRTAEERKKRSQASYLTRGGGEGDAADPTRKSYLGSGM